MRAVGAAPPAAAARSLGAPLAARIAAGGGEEAVAMLRALRAACAEIAAEGPEGPEGAPAPAGASWEDLRRHVQAEADAAARDTHGHALDLHIGFAHGGEG